jgi:hypothetical protein
MVTLTPRSTAACSSGRSEYTREATQADQSQIELWAAETSLANCS